MNEIDMECKIRYLENQLSRTVILTEEQGRKIWNLQKDVEVLQARADTQCQILGKIAEIFKKQEKISGDVIDTLRELVKKSS